MKKAEEGYSLGSYLEYTVIFNRQTFSKNP